MSKPAKSTVDSAHVITERARRLKDGSVLLSLADDRICRLNGVGALTWMVLEDIPVSLTLDEIVRELKQQFDAINSRGELLYDVSHEQLRADTARFLDKLVTMNLLQASCNSHGQEFYSIQKDVSATTSATFAEAGDPEAVPTRSNESSETIAVKKHETFGAFLGLLAFDLLLKFAGFQSLMKRVKRWPTAEPRRADLQTCRRVRGMVDRAQMYYPKKAMCLQHSAVVTCLLRRRGVPAEMVVAAQEFPVRVHAWTEVASCVVNDHQSVKARYRELRRI